MRKIALALALVVAASSASAEGFGGGFGGGLGISIPDPIGGLPNGVERIDGAKVNAFWSCFFAPNCNAFKLDLSQYSDEKEKEDE